MRYAISIMIVSVLALGAFSPAGADQILIGNPSPETALLQLGFTSPQWMQWTRIAIPGAPLNAKAVILNVEATAYGIVGDTPSAIAMRFRKPGSTVPVGPAIGARAVSDALTIGDTNMTTVFVPLNRAQKIEYYLEGFMSGSVNDVGLITVKVQGFILKD